VVKLTKSTKWSLFNVIAPVYGLFYNFQKHKYSQIINRVENEIDFSPINKILDIGCGTGALCSVFRDLGMEVTGIDPAQKMLDIAVKKTGDSEIKFYKNNVLEGLPFDDKSFDLAISSYVLHGLGPDERKRVYFEMSRVANKFVIIHDYNKKRSLLTSIIEWMERGDYFNFIKSAELEMKECTIDFEKCFSDVKVLNVDVRANWYICIPK